MNSVFTSSITARYGRLVVWTICATTLLMLGFGVIVVPLIIVIVLPKLGVLLRRMGILPSDGASWKRFMTVVQIMRVWMIFLLIHGAVVMAVYRFDVPVQTVMMTLALGFLILTAKVACLILRQGWRFRVLLNARRTMRMIASIVEDEVSERSEGSQSQQQRLVRAWLVVVIGLSLLCVGLLWLAILGSMTTTALYGVAAMLLFDFTLLLLGYVATRWLLQYGWALYREGWIANR